MLVVVWIALAVGAVAALSGIAYAGLHALRGWRTFRAVSRSLTGGLDTLATAATAAGERAATVTGRSSEIVAANDRLQRSLAELTVLRHAAAQTRSSVQRVTGLVPQK